MKPSLLDLILKNGCNGLALEGIANTIPFRLCGQWEVREPEAKFLDGAVRVRPPYGNMWVEGLRTEDGCLVGFHVRTLEDGALLAATQVVGLPEARSHSQSRPVAPCAITVTLGAGGEIVGADRIYVDETVAAHMDPRGFEEPMKRAFTPHLYALALMNCRNVEDRAPEGKMSRARRKAGEAFGRPLVVHRTLHVKVPGTKTWQPVVMENGIDGAGGTKLHTVRGHFKHYTSDAPLFGRLTGTFWCPPFLRGDRERGVVVKDYEVSVS